MTISFDTHPSRYKHWKLSFDGEIATLAMQVDPNGGLKEGYELKLNSYDLGVDIELADAIQRVRFEHPEVKCVVVTSGTDRVFCSGANIYMLGSSTHAWKVNFCKFTNETRLYLEDASKHSGIKFLCAVNGACAGGGYELALACDEILLVDDGSSAVSLPEVPLLAVLPGTGGLTRVVDKRKVRRDLADVFCTTSEGVRGKRAVEWGLVDAIAPRSRFADAVKERAASLAKKAGDARKGAGIELDALAPEIDGGTYRYRFVTLAIDATTRVATLTMKAPTGSTPEGGDAIQAAGASQWSLRAFRELDDALLRLRIDHLDVGMLVLRTEGDAAKVVATDRALHAAKDHWLANEILRLQARVLRRLDLTSRSIFALIEKSSAFGGSLLELALASDRIYMLADDDEEVAIAVSPANAGALPMSHGLSRLEARFQREPERVQKVLATEGAITTEDANALGLVTVAPDEIDWDDDVRIAIEERASLSPDALTGMEASLRFAGPETMETKIFARLSAWQNWIFQRPNAVGPQGALTKYGQPDRAVFAWTRC
ncbi:2,3-epoxybenzoyl-CoA dihydrolase [Sandaracinus amylolyticus]|uniref:Benzoyl-CoA-dihydrodiol lyase (BoxC) n=1 Tax=Sandaracinus amylolyticus TaxID=927083 RepID=A0A0F6W222_9BACT|nr:2,3-epoxybenzoyl-CoA dihydrolase [Sandaracinus amylolyticus]AKF05475.1 benzoyl-CoA-dihydrodiol lyase (BoxC) [Sandaracinus amylolyticus]